MCGIAGFFIVPSIRARADELLESMVSTLSHRGPDGWGTYLSPEIAIGHTRLSIVDPAGGKQPMMSDRYVLAYNGEIFNYIELREQLVDKGICFKTQSDTEVVLKAFAVYGPEAFAMFNGQFAMLIWDRLEKKLVLARDRYGIRPLYVLAFKGSYYFASEMKAFDVIDGFQRTYNMQNLLHHGLLWNTIGDTTIYENIRSISAGTYEVFSPADEPRKYRYYEIGETRGATPVSFDEAKEQFASLLEDSVQLRLRSDVPVGAYLSGGVDSSVISYLAARSTSNTFKTFSVTFEDKEFDESSYQNDMIRLLDADHHARQISYADIENNLLDAAYHMERPVFRSASVPLFLLSGKVRDNGIKVVLTGEGADEILFGYDSFKELKLLNFWKKNAGSKYRPLLIKKLYPHLQHYSDPEKFGLLRMYYEGFLPEYDNEMSGLNIRVHNNKILLNMFNKDHPLSFDKNRLLQDIRAILPDNFFTWSCLQQNQFLEMKSLLSGYLLSSQGDRMSMAHSVEGRYPYLDHRLVELVFNMPDTYKLKVFSQKHLLAEAFKPVLPASIIQRPKKPYTAPDLKSLFQHGALAEKSAYFLSDQAIDKYGIFDIKLVRRFLDKFNNNNFDNFGYRDNMLAVFILTAQMCAYCCEHPQTVSLGNIPKDIDIIDN